ncbi:MAG: 4a-hydroxytetrahydrobiopterin dehydratase [Candidatus Liptonbacteria bacterium]|nr:4a-hydroxytetrahydrobiopterin dehydratase [Candidatus Liptonbacteria bacterium]
MNLSQKHCVPCEGGVPPLKHVEIERFLPQVPSWQVLNGKKIVRNFKFNGFEEAVQFVNRVAKLAETENHHPDIHIFYNKVKLELATHAIHGLSENDFILGAKIDELHDTHR